MSVRLVDMDARCKYHDKKKKKFGEHWLFIGIAGIVMYEKKSLSLSLPLMHTRTHLEMQETEDGNLTDMRVYE